MANWITIVYKIDGDKEKTLEMYQDINGAILSKEPVSVSGFGPRWIGCMVKALGGNPNEVYCRGRVVKHGYSYSDGILTIMVDIAESMYCDELLEFLQEKASGCKVHYLTDDACGTRYSNDKDWKYFSEFYPKESVRIV